jgi:hypothetical protein
MPPLMMRSNLTMPASAIGMAIELNIVSIGAAAPKANRLLSMG